MVLAGRSAKCLRAVGLLLALYKCVYAIDWLIPAAEVERIFGDENGGAPLYLVRDNRVERQMLVLSETAMNTHVRFSWIGVSLAYCFKSASTNPAVLKGADFGGPTIGTFTPRVFDMSFPCTGTQQGRADVTVTLNFTYDFTMGDLRSLVGQIFTLSGSRQCNCTNSQCNSDPTDPPNDGGVNNEIFYIVIGCVGGVILLVIMVTVLYHCIMLGMWVKRRSQDEEPLPNIEDVIPMPPYSMVTITPLSSQMPIAPLTNSPRNSRTFSIPSDLSKSIHSLQSFKVLFVDRKRISIGQVLKEGVFGVMYDGYLSNAEDDVEGAIPVIIKTVKDNTPDIVVRSLLEGGGATRTVSHRHVLPLLAAHASDTEQPMLLFPKTSLGTLKGLLMRCREPKRGSLTLTTQNLVFMAGQISRGMYHLTRKGLIHRDLAARNIYVHESLHIKIGDRGLSWDLFPSEYSRLPDGEMCPIRWMSAEVLSERKYSHYSDVWSFGVVLWELMTLGRVPYEEVPAEDMLAMLTAGHRLSQPKNCPDELFVLMGWCWALTPTDRPRFSHLTLRLKEFHEKINAFV